MTEIRWAKDPAYECDHDWMSKDEARLGSGPHRCLKDVGHESDPTNDDHQCCCGNISDD